MRTTPDDSFYFLQDESRATARAYGVTGTPSCAIIRADRTVSDLLIGAEQILGRLNPLTNEQPTVSALLQSS